MHEIPILQSIVRALACLKENAFFSMVAIEYLAIFLWAFVTNNPKIELGDTDHPYHCKLQTNANQHNLLETKLGIVVTAFTCCSNPMVKSNWWHKPFELSHTRKLFKVGSYCFLARYTA